MRVKVIAKRVSGIGVKGQEKDIDTRSARVLILLGKVVEVVKEAKPEKIEKPEKPKRTSYKRRDLVAEASPAIEPEPALDVDPVTGDDIEDAEAD